MNKAFSALLLLIGCATITQAQVKVRFVDPFIGTGAAGVGLPGCNFPGPTVPFGFVQLSPDTKEAIDAHPCSGYDYEAKTIVGFSHTHLSGTGIADLADVLMMPTTGAIKTDAGTEGKPGSGYRSRFSHEQEVAKPGYYSVQLLDYNIKAELTATMHAGFHRYTFPEGKDCNLIIDMDHSSVKGNGGRNTRIMAAQIKVIDSVTISGYRVLSGWAKMRRVYFYAKFSKPFASTLMVEGKYTYPNKNLATGNANIKAAVTFKNAAGKSVMVKVGLSANSVENAKENLNQEITDWNFDKIATQTENIWEKELAKYDVDGTLEQKKIYYTCLYHAFTQPNNIADVNGDYIAGDLSTANAGRGKEVFSTFSLWDTYRAAHPLYTLTQTEKTAGFINSMINHYKTYGFLPVWELWGSETYCMISNHAIPVIVDAIMKGVEGFDVNAAYEAVKGTSMTDHKDSPMSIWEKFGYMPEDLQSQSVSITLETAYNDWCVAQLAKKLGKMDDYKYFAHRAANYKNLYDTNTGFFRAKNSDGKWLEPFNPLEYGHNGGHPFTEANAWQYLWYVPHNVNDLSRLMGGEQKFGDRLDQFFTLVDTGKINHNASGFIGQYAHGNEPSHHIAYLYNFSDRQWKGQMYISKILNEMYSATPKCYIGNDDCGQMSAWYIFSSMGFYPVNPANSIYNIGSPVLKSASIKLDNGKTFTMKAPNASKENCYIQSMKLNGQAYNKAYITQADLTSGSTLEFVMGSKPSSKKLLNYVEPN